MATVILAGSTVTTTQGAKSAVFTPAVGDLIVFVTAYTSATADHVAGDTQSGVYTQVQANVKSGSGDSLHIYIRNTLITSAVSTTFGVTLGTGNGSGIAVFRVTGMTKTGALAKRQSGGQDNQSNSTPATALGGAALTTNPMIAAVLNTANPAGLTPPSGFTEHFDVGYANPGTGFEVTSIDSGFTGSTVTWGSNSSSAFASIAVELDASGAGAFTLSADAGAYT